MDVEYIALETTDEFITHGNVMDIGKKFIIVKNNTNDGNIFIFDRKTGKQARLSIAYLFHIPLRQRGGLLKLNLLSC